MSAYRSRCLVLALLLCDAGWLFAQTTERLSAVDIKRFEAETQPYLKAQRGVSTDTVAATAATPDRVTWFQYQTPVRNQLNRNIRERIYLHTST